MLKWNFVWCLVLLAASFLQAQTVKRNAFSVQLNEHTIVLDSAGNRLPYNQLLQKLSGGNYTLDPIKNASGGNTGQYRLRAKQVSDDGWRDTKVVQPGIVTKSGPAPGDVFPFFSGFDADSLLLNSADLQGKVVVVNFWFSQCKPCIAELPGLNALVDSFRTNKEVVFLAPDFEKRPVVKRFLQTNVLRYRVFPEAETLVKNCNIAAYPTHLIIGRNGRVLKSYSGGLSGIENLLKHDIEEALKQ